MSPLSANIVMLTCWAFKNISFKFYFEKKTYTNDQILRSGKKQPLEIMIYPANSVIISRCLES